MRDFILKVVSNILLTNAAEALAGSINVYKLYEPFVVANK